MINDKQNFVIERVYSHPISRRTTLFLSSDYIQGIFSQNIYCVPDVFQEGMLKHRPSNNVLDFQFSLESYSKSSNNIDVYFNSSMQRNLQKLSKIALLGENWNGYGAKPVSPFVLRQKVKQALLRSHSNFLQAMQFYLIFVSYAAY